jgi:hypothetical protein
VPALLVESGELRPGCGSRRYVLLRGFSEVCIALLELGGVGQVYLVPGGRDESGRQLCVSPYLVEQ